MYRSALVKNKKIMPNKVNKICANPNCKKEFRVLYKKRSKKYCCRGCYFEHARTEKIIGRKKDESCYEIRKCLNCGVEFEERKKWDKKLCSDECRKEWNSIPENKEARLQRSREGNLKKYGVESPFGAEEVRKRSKKTMEEKYGVSNAMEIPGAIEKQKDNKRKKYINGLVSRLKDHNLELLDEYSTNKDENTSIHYHFKCNNCNTTFTSTLLGSGIIPVCRTCYPLNSNSNLQYEIEEFLNKNNIEYIKNDRNIISPMEVDIYIPDHNLAIEINGNYWHSEIYKTKNYHLNKTKKCYDKGIKLIHIFEDEIYYKKDICLSRLKNQLGMNNNSIYSRKCSIKELTNKEKKKFLEENHIQGDSIDKIRLGLFHNTKLVSVMTFSKKRKVMGNNHTSGEWELTRFCNEQNTTVIGSFNKLLKHFIRDYTPTKITSYVDIRWSGIDDKNNIYANSGFEFMSKTRPNYWYLKKHDWFYRRHRFNFRKDVLVKEGYDKNKTEHEIMNERDFYKIWDCGNLKFEMANFEDI